MFNSYYFNSYYNILAYYVIITVTAITLAVTEGLVREEQLLHDLCLLGAVTVEITQILTRAGLLTLLYLNPSKIEPSLVMW